MGVKVDMRARRVMSLHLSGVRTYPGDKGADMRALEARAVAMHDLNAKELQGERDRPAETTALGLRTTHGRIVLHTPRDDCRAIELIDLSRIDGLLESRNSRRLGW
jgi:hypothetical protein